MVAGRSGGKHGDRKGWRETRWREEVEGIPVVGRGGGRGVAEMVAENKIGFAKPDCNESGYSTPI
jgi:hypothetical protein